MVGSSKNLKIFYAFLIFSVGLFFHSEISGAQDSGQVGCWWTDSQGVNHNSCSSGSSSSETFSGPNPIIEFFKQLRAARDLKKANKFLDRADEALKQNDYDEALRLVEEARKREPGWTTTYNHYYAIVYNRQANALYQSGDKNGALGLYERALSLWPEDKQLQDNVNYVRNEFEYERQRREDEARRKAENEAAGERIGNMLSDFDSQLEDVNILDTSEFQWDGGPGSTLGNDLGFRDSLSNQNEEGSGDLEFGTSEALLFSKGTKDSAPVVIGGETTQLAGDPDLFSKTGEKPIMDLSRFPADDLRDEPKAFRQAGLTPPPRELLQGEALKNAQKQAKTSAAVDLAAQLYQKEDYLTSLEYAQKAFAADPNCEICVLVFFKSFEKVVETQKILEELTKLPSPEEIEELFGGEKTPKTIEELRKELTTLPSDEEILEMFSDKPAWDEPVEDLERTPRFNIDLFEIKKTKADYILDALEFGDGDWSASQKYLDDFSRIRPFDDEALEAKAYLDDLVRGLESAENPET